MHPAKHSSRASHGCQRRRMAAQDSGIAVGSLEMTWRWRVPKVWVGRGLCAWPIMRPRRLVVWRPRPPIQRRFSISSTHPCPGPGLEWIGLMVWGPCGRVSAAKVQGMAALLGEKPIDRHGTMCLAGREEKGGTKRWRAGVDCAVGAGQWVLGCCWLFLSPAHVVSQRAIPGLLQKACGGAVQ